MSHDINAMTFVGELPWHGLGTRLPANATYEQVCEGAGFYNVTESPLYLPDGALIPDRKALLRGDDGRYLSTVSKTYQVVQAEAVAQTLVQAAGDVGAIIHTAGTLGPVGIRGWILAELPNPLRVRGDSSEIRKYLLGTFAHDGCNAVLLKNVGTRVVCANTLGAALGEDSKFTNSIRHTRNAEQRLAQAVASFRELVAGYEVFEEVANLLAVTPFSDKQMRATVETLLPMAKDDTEPTENLTEKREKVTSLFSEGAGMDGIRGTAWAGFQAWTEYADHHRTTRGATASSRLESIWLGRSANLKQKALASILEVAGLQKAA